MYVCNCTLHTLLRATCMLHAVYYTMYEITHNNPMEDYNWLYIPRVYHHCVNAQAGWAIYGAMEASVQVGPKYYVP